MKLFNLLFLVIILVTLQKSTAKEVAFPDSINGNGKILIDGHNISKLKNCRYNDAGIVFCEVYFDYTETHKRCSFKPKYVGNYGGPPAIEQECKDVKEVVNSHYRIRIELSMSGKCNLSNESKFKEIKLTYNYKGKDNYAQLITECYDSMSKGYLPASFGTYKNLRYRFTFKTTKNCTFKGEFSKIKAYKA